MKPRLIVMLTADQVVMEYAITTQEPGFWGLWGHLRRSLNLGKGERSVTYERGCASISNGSLAGALQTSFDQLRKTSGMPAGGAELEAKLGLRHSRIGLMQLDDATSSQLTADTGDVLINAWIRQMWAMDPITQLVRWQRIGRSSKVLVSCVERGVFDGLEVFSREYGFRFVSCLPALLNEVNELPSELHTDKTGGDPVARTKTLVWTEECGTGQRDAVVHLLRHDGGRLESSWRGWVGAAALHGPDKALQGALRRFKAFSKAPFDEHVVYRHWPTQGQVDSNQFNKATRPDVVRPLDAQDHTVTVAIDAR